MHDCNLETLQAIEPAALKANSRNVRTHSKKQIRQIAKSIEAFGFTNPVLIDEHNVILAGHGRIEAAKLMGLETVPCRLLANMSEAQKRAYVLADNKLALNAGWHEELLAIELGELQGIELEFDLDVTGFSITEIDGLIEGLAPEDPGDPADHILPKDAPRRFRPGDVRGLGRHRLVSCDALSRILSDFS